MPVNAPKCKVCGSSHWLNEAHSWSPELHPAELIEPRSRKTGPAESRRKSLSAAIITGGELLETVRAAGELVKAVDAKIARKAYMRAYMAKRRAKP